MRGERIWILLSRVINGPLAKHHLNGASLAGRWWPNIECWLGSFKTFQGTRNRIAQKPCRFVIFQCGSGPPVSHSGSAHVVNLRWCAGSPQPSPHADVWLFVQSNDLSTIQTAENVWHRCDKSHNAASHQWLLKQWFDIQYNSILKF